MGLMMEDEKVKELLDLTRDNNRMLRAMRRSAFIGGIIKFVFYALVLVILPYVTWLYIQPYLEGALNQYNQIQDKTGALQAAGSVNLTDLQALVQKYIGGAK